MTTSSTASSSQPAAPISVAELESLISPERFRTYIRATSGPQQAFELYTWNARVSGAFSELLHHVEVVVRNAMHERLIQLHAAAPGRAPGAQWFDGPSWVRHHWFSQPALASIGTAVRAAGHTSGNPRPGKVVSELNFGFWRYLASDRYEQSLWAPALDGVFAAPGGTVRDRRLEVESRLGPLHQLRNRIAHCEPIFGTITYRRRRRPPVVKALGDLRVDAVELVAWISPNAARWLESDVDQVAQLLAARP